MKTILILVIIVVDLGTRETGGWNEVAFTGNGLVPRLKHIAAELTHQYLVAYARPESLIPPRVSTIGATRQGLTVRGTLVKDAKDRP